MGHARVAPACAATLALASALGGCVVYVPVSSTVVGGVMLVGIIGNENRKPVELTADRVVSEVDCTKPLPEGLTGNVRCKPPALN